MRNRKEKIIAKEQSKKINQMPMNKDFFNAVNDKGELLYPIAARIGKYLNYRFEDTLDKMRQINSYVAQIRHHENRIERLQEQYDNKVVEFDERGRLYSKPEVQLLIMSEKIAIPRDLSKIREYLIEKLLPMINAVTFPGEVYNNYVLYINKLLTKMGYELIPDKVEPIFPEL